MSAWSVTSSGWTPSIVRGLLADGRIPVVSSVARGVDGAVYNVNADTAAAALAVALGAEKLVVLTDVEGLYADWDADGGTGEVISSLAADELEQMLPGLSAGMVPKMEACLRAVRGGVRKAHVLDGRVPARAAARGLHRLRHRHRGDLMTAPTADPGNQPSSAPGGSAVWTERYAGAMMRTYGTPPAGAGARRGGHRLRRRRAGLPGPAGRHRGERARPRPPGPGRGGVPAGRHPRARLEPTSPPRRRCGWPSGCSSCSSDQRHRAPGPGVPHQLRRRGERGRGQARPAAPVAPRSSPPSTASTAAPWGRCR